MKKHQCPDCGKVYECALYGDDCRDGYEQRCTACAKARVKFYSSMAAAAAAYSEAVRKAGDAAMREDAKECP